jgi:diguanylate cyclase (GGDEF)-like protein
MLGGRRLAIGITVFWALALPVMYYVTPMLIDLTGEPFHEPKASSRTFWLVLASVVALTFALHFDGVSQALQRRLREMAERDPLTGVGNRRALDIALTRSLSFARRQGGSVTLVILDLDNFKRFNDSRGHGEGDRALIRIAETLVAHCRAGQDSVARFGGEEFVLVLGQTDQQAARFVVEKIRRAVVDLALRYDDVSDDVLTITLGYTSVAGEAEVDHDDLLRRADAALYAGKRLGRDRAVSADDLPEGLEGLAAETHEARRG